MNPLLYLPIAVAICGAIFFVMRYGRAAANKAVGEQRTELIGLMEKNHEALEQRVKLLEEKLEEAERRAELLARQLEQSLDAYDTLKEYAAPEAVKRFTGMFETFSVTTSELIINLAARVTAQAEVVDAIRENTEAIRERVSADHEVAQALRESVANRRSEDGQPPDGVERRST
jgi:predicted ribosome quality control (RQC) complex YloA/Tae2 family protein